MFDKCSSPDYGEEPKLAIQQLMKWIESIGFSQQSLAETRRFELPIQGLARCSLSRGVPSTTRPRLRKTLKLQVSYSNGFIKNPQGISATYLIYQQTFTSVQVQKLYVMP